MREPSVTLRLLWSCLSALHFVIDRQPCRGTFFVEQGGDKAVLAALRVGKQAGTDGESVLISGMQLVASLVDGNASVAQRLRAPSCLEVLVTSGLSLPGKSSAETMWTLGQVGGVLPVLEVMSRARDSSEAEGHGLSAIAKLTWKPLDEALQQQLPNAAEALLGLVRKVAADGNAKKAEMALQALGGVLHMLAVHVSPGKWAVVDEGISLLAKALGPNSDDLVAQAAAASIGHIVTCSPSWRAPLQPLVLADLVRRMRSPGEKEDSLKHQKCLFWVAAVVGGLKVVLQEMQSQPNSPTVVESCLSGLCDALEPHADGHSVAGDESVTIQPSEVLGAFEIIQSAMHLHRTHVLIQWYGNHAVGLLVAALPASESVPVVAIECIHQALRRNPTEYKVASSAFTAMRTFLEPRGGSGVKASLVTTVTALRGKDMAGLTRRILADYAHSTDATLLENACFVLGLSEGINCILQTLISTETSQVAVRSGGLNAIFELGRQFPDLLQPVRPDDMLKLVQAIVDAVTAVNAGSPTAVTDGSLSADEGELLRRAELVRGLCIQPSRTMCQQHPLVAG